MAVREPARLYSAAQSRAVDRCAIEEHGLPGTVLMARAARAAFRELLLRWPQPGLLQVLCGPGNNGGDGLLLAALAQERGIATRVYLVDGEPRSEDARHAARRARVAGVEPAAFRAAALERRGLVVDAMLGTGIQGPPRPAYAEAISAVNALALPVLAIDVPSGLDGDSGAVAGVAIAARCTVSFITAKRGLYTALGPEHAGERLLDDLDVPAAAFAAAGEAVELLDLARERGALPERPPAAHKGRFGRCLLVGGDHGMGGAVLLAAEAALRSGVGLLRVATREAHIAPLLARRPEAMARAVRGYNDLKPLLAWADAVIIGPGLGVGPWGEQLLLAVREAGLPTLYDADALNLAAAQEGWRWPARSLVTPHPGEAARLLDCTAAAVQADRFAALQALIARGVDAAILKGNGSLVAGRGALALCAAGNPGMASGGMGDVLSGIGGALLAQGLEVEAAARLACLVHALAADRAAQELGETALLASDLAPRLAELLP
jgi:hydroxyethylthiazole kinase-like uncharacterized protein yjeF